MRSMGGLQATRRSVRRIISLPAIRRHGRGMYTFCMCPGGTVVCAASEQGGVVVNGMSEWARDGENANSAILVGIEPAYFSSDHPLAGMHDQRKIEHAAFRLGGGDYTGAGSARRRFFGGQALP